MSTDTPAWPTELRLHKDRRTLTVSFEGGETFDLPAEYLRVKSPSAEVQGHSAEERKTVPGKREVGICLDRSAVRLESQDQSGFAGGKRAGRCRLTRIDEAARRRQQPFVHEGPHCVGAGGEVGSG